MVPDEEEVRMSETWHDPEDGAQEPAETELVEQDLLVEDVSIDGMCGVY
jgi:mycofactocin precursor